jgi:hypothetical protein
MRLAVTHTTRSMALALLTLQLAADDNGHAGGRRSARCVDGKRLHGRDRVANRDVTNQPDYSRARGACAYRGAVTESDASPRSRRQLMEI